MGHRRARLLFVLASLTAALVVSAAVAGAGSRAGAVKVAAPSAIEERVVAYGTSQLLLIRPTHSEEPGITRINMNGSVDRSFGDQGTVEMASEDAAVARDGKILVSTSSSGDNGDARVTRLLRDGRPDPSFGVRGSADVDFGGRYDNGQAVALAANGRILLGGSRQGPFVGRGESSAAPAVARLRPDGSLDRSFGRKGVRFLGGGGEVAVLDVAPTPGGGIVIEVGNEIEADLWKLTRDGSADTDFGRDGWLEMKMGRESHGRHEELFVAPELAVLPSGKLLLAATGFPSGPNPRFRVVAVRLRPDGRVDRSYGDDGWAVSRSRGHARVEGLALLPGGVLAVATTFNRPPGEWREFGAIAFGPDGRVERRFGRHGRCRTRLGGEYEVLDVGNVNGRAAVVGWGGGHQWLLNCPRLRKR